jgi:hypothetical protein
VLLLRQLRRSRYGTDLYGACEMSQDPAAPDSAPSDPARCSARACREPAVVELRWRNPGLHDGTRVKIWTACGEHTESLRDFLDRRGFLLEQVTIEG